MKGIKKDNEKLPYFTVLCKQFPLAIEALVSRSLQGHLKYIENDADYLNWRRIDNPEKRYQEALLRHAMYIGNEDTEIEHIAATMWNCAALLQLKLEKK